MSELKPCPFCGAKAEIERIGNARQSTIYRCTICGCSLETGEEFNHGDGWNQRDDTPALLRGARIGLEMAAKKIKGRAEDYHNEHGNYDPSTGVWEYPGNGDEYLGELEEIQEDIRAIPDTDIMKEISRE